VKVDLILRKQTLYGWYNLVIILHPFMVSTAALNVLLSCTVWNNREKWPPAWTRQNKSDYMGIKWITQVIIVVKVGFFNVSWLLNIRVWVCDK